MSYLYCQLGPQCQPVTFFYKFTTTKNSKIMVYAWPIATIGSNTLPMAASSGFYQSPGSPPSGDALSIVPVNRCGHQNGQQSWSMFSLTFCLLLPWQPLGWYGASSCLIVAPSGFQGSPGHAALGDAVSVLLRCTAMAVKMAGGWGTFAHHCLLFPWHYS